MINEMPPEMQDLVNRVFAENGGSISDAQRRMLLKMTVGPRMPTEPEMYLTCELGKHRIYSRLDWGKQLGNEFAAAQKRDAFRKNLPDDSYQADALTQEEEALAVLWYRRLDENDPYNGELNG